MNLLGVLSADERGGRQHLADVATMLLTATEKKLSVLDEECHLLDGKVAD